MTVLTHTGRGVTLVILVGLLLLLGSASLSRAEEPLLQAKAGIAAAAESVDSGLSMEAFNGQEGEAGRQPASPDLEPLSVEPSAVCTWTGAVNTSFLTAGNWDCGHWPPCYP